MSIKEVLRDLNSADCTYMNAGARALRSDAPPTIRWPTMFTDKMKEIFGEILRHIVIIAQTLLLLMFTETRFEQVEWRIVAIVLSVINEVFHFQLHRSSIVVLADFELLIAILSCQFVDRPFLERRPIVDEMLNDHWFAWTFIFLNEILARNIPGVGRVRFDPSDR